MLLRSASQTECDPTLPALYSIDNVWYRFTPHPIVVPSPQSLQPSSKPTWHYASIGNLANSGIYSEADIKKLRDRIMFPAEKPALLNNIARGSVGYSIPAGSVSIRGLLDENTLDHLAESAARKFWHGFEKFGIASAGVFAIFVIFKVIKTIIDTCIHGYAIHTLYGWSVYLLGALWSSVTGLLLTLGHKRNRIVPSEDNNESTSMERVNTPNPDSVYPNLTARDAARFSTSMERVNAPNAESVYPNLTARESTRVAMPTSRIDPLLIQRLYAGPTQSHGTASD